MDGSFPSSDTSEHRDESPFRCENRVPEGSLAGFSVVVTDNAGHCSIAVAHLGNFRVLITVTRDGAVTMMRREPNVLRHD